jgi:hypothetical protein
VYANVFLKLMKNSVVLPKLVSSEYKDIVVKPISNTGQPTAPPSTPSASRSSPSATAPWRRPGRGGRRDRRHHRQAEGRRRRVHLEETLTVDALLKSKIMQAGLGPRQPDRHGPATPRPRSSTPGSARRAGDQLLRRPDRRPQRLDEMAVEADGRVGLLHPSDAWAMLGSLSGLTAQTKEATDALTKRQAADAGQHRLVLDPERRRRSPAARAPATPWSTAPARTSPTLR